MNSCTCAKYCSVNISRVMPTTKALNGPSMLAVAQKGGWSARQGCPQARLLDLPVPVLTAVDQDHRHPVAVLRAQLRVGVHVLGRPGHAQLVADAADVRL